MEHKSTTFDGLTVVYDPTRRELPLQGGTTRVIQVGSLWLGPSSVEAVNKLWAIAQRDAAIERGEIVAPLPEAEIGSPWSLAAFDLPLALEGAAHGS